MSEQNHEANEPEQKGEANEPEQKGEANEPGQRAGAPDFMGQLDPLMESIAALNAEIESIKTAVSALANAGAVNASVNEDNGGSEDYPEIDLDEVNRLIGA